MGNFSNNTFDELKRYVSVRLQQGVPLLDSDWNEMDDIRRYEVRTFLKWFVGDGVSKGSNGFKITPAGNDFSIGAGYFLLDGWEVTNSIQIQGRDIKYSEQTTGDDKTADPLPSFPSSWPLEITIYLDMWDIEVSDINNPVYNIVGIESCVRLKREWVVRWTGSYIENAANLPNRKNGHCYYVLANQSATKHVPFSDRRKTVLADWPGEITIDPLTGYVGIGTTTPQSPLQVVPSLTVGSFAAFASKDSQGNSHSEGNLSISGSVAGLDIARRSLTAWPVTPAAGDRFELYNSDGTLRLWTDQQGDLLSVTGNGNVIVGTPGPEDKYIFEVAGRMKVRGDRVTGTAGIWFSQQYGFGERAFTGLFDDNHIGFFGNTGAKWGLVMDTGTGNVGIGTTSPGAALSVGQYGAAVSGGLSGCAVFGHNLATHSSGQDLYTIYDTPNNGYCGIRARWGALEFFTSTDKVTAGQDVTAVSPRLKIDVNGNIGIGTSNPSTNMEIATGTLRISSNKFFVDIDPWSGSNGSAISFNENGNQKANLYWNTNSQIFYINSAGASSTSINLNGGNVGIGMAPTTNYMLAVKGNAYSYGGQWQGSDKQYKKNIEHIKNALSGVLSIRGITHEWKIDKYKDKGFSDGKFLGVIAQEIESVFPEAVREGPDGEKAVSYSALIPILIEAVKEQQLMIDQMSKSLAELKSKLKKTK